MMHIHSVQVYFTLDCICSRAQRFKDTFFKWEVTPEKNYAAIFDILWVLPFPLTAASKFVLTKQGKTRVIMMSN
jgi:hypothetical protein